MSFPINFGSFHPSHVRSRACPLDFSQSVVDVGKKAASEIHILRFFDSVIGPIESNP